MAYTPKELHFSDEGRTSLIRGISKISSAVKSTLGPRGNTVLIESQEHLHGITVTKDGVTVAKSVSLLDPVENLAVRMMKEAAERTATSAGDGTTTAIVLAEALVRIGTKLIAEDVNRSEVVRYLMSEAKEIGALLRAKARSVDIDNVEGVATISANNDASIGKIIADVYKAVGKDGIVTVERGMGADTYYETTEGIKVDRGYTSPLFINDHKKDECVYDDVYLLVSDIEISNILQIENVLKPIINEKKRLLIIAPCSQTVVNTLSANVMKNGLSIVNINPPDFGYRKHDLMQDIALSFGATYFSEQTGDDLSIIQPSDLGHCGKVVVGKSNTILFKSEQKSSDLLEKRVSELRELYEQTQSKADKDFILKRIASLTGGIGVIYVGGNTDLEQKELYDRIEDAVNAVRSALQEGILAGGGLALWNVAKRYGKKTHTNKSKGVVYGMLAVALEAPLRRILTNAGMDADAIYDDSISWVWGYDVKGERYGHMFNLGIIDPVKVTRNALQNAVSVASTILSTNAIITMVRANSNLVANEKQIN